MQRRGRHLDRDDIIIRNYLKAEGAPKDLRAAVAYCATMLGFHTPEGPAWLLAGIIAKPYYLGTVMLCALVVWTCPQTWDWSRRLGPGKAVTALALLLLAVTVLTTQAYNPFIYFIF